MKKIRLKSELFWVKEKDGIDVFFNNDQLSKRLKIDRSLINNTFSFFRFLSTPRSKKEINEWNLLSSAEKTDLLVFLQAHKYVVEEEDHIIKRSEAFINSIPMTNFSEYKERISDTNILIIGVGTAGSYLLEVLTKLGFQNFTLIDGDVVEEKNLQAQIYRVNDIGEPKVAVLKNRYSDIYNLHIIQKYVPNFDILSNLVDFESFDYVINTADHLELMLDIASHLSFNTEKSKKTILIEGGYGTHQQNIYKIDSDEMINTILSELKRLSKNSEDWIVDNNGSIMNSFFHALAVGKIIIDDIVNLNNSTIAFADFLRNDFFIGSFLQEKIFNRVIKQKEIYSTFKKINPNRLWIDVITKDNLYNNNLKNSFDTDFSSTERTFLFENKKNTGYITAEYQSFELSSNMDSIDSAEEELIMNLLYTFIETKFGLSKKQYVLNTVKFGLNEMQYKSMVKGTFTSKIGENYFIVNNEYTNQTDRFLNRVHELLHVVYWDITNDSYEHEYFVMRNELEFLQANYEKIPLEIVTHYVKNKLSAYSQNYIVSKYEQAVINKNLDNFKIEFNTIIKDNETVLIDVLNQRIDRSLPLSKLRYVMAFEKNYSKIQELYAKITSGKETDD